VGADTDGYYRIAILSADQIEKCYAQNAGDRRHVLRHESHQMKTLGVATPPQPLAVNR
jgi:hypothetical protein